MAAPEAAPCSTNSVADSASRNTGKVPASGSFLKRAKPAAAMEAALGPSRVLGGMDPRMLRSGFAPAPGPPLYCRTARTRQYQGTVQWHWHKPPLARPWDACDTQCGFMRFHK
jgi:hypothetical protein